MWTRLHKSYRIGSCPGDDPRHGRARQMDPCVLPAVIQLRSEDVFSISVCPEIDRARGDDADEGWAEAFEEGSGRFMVVYVFHYVACFDEVVEEATSVVVRQGKGEGDGGGGGGGRGEDGRGCVYLEEGGL